MDYELKISPNVSPPVNGQRRTENGKNRSPFLRSPFTFSPREAHLSPVGHFIARSAFILFIALALLPLAATAQSMQERAHLDNPWVRWSRPLVIIKTNLLYDVALTPHLGVEVPLGERFSIGAEFMRGWWLKRDWSACWQLEAAALEGRYWFRNCTERHLLGGWFAGVFAQAGFYDFQLNTSSGIQGECLMAGLSGGYVCPLGGNWSIAFSLGVGYLLTDYRRYTVAPTHDGYELVASAPAMRFRGLPYPIKAGISLQWAITRGKIMRWL
jgi:hypothetical protein